MTAAAVPAAADTARDLAADARDAEQDRRQALQDVREASLLARERSNERTLADTLARANVLYEASYEARDRAWALADRAAQTLRRHALSAERRPELPPAEGPPL